MDGRWPSRRVVETAGLVLALLAVGLGIAYVVWPPSARYLYRKAEALMASKDRHDWVMARNTYLDELDRRFPANPYQKTTRQWRDRILLDEAQGRARTLDSAVRTLLSEPQTDGERLYLGFGAAARKEVDRGDDLAAARLWDSMAQQVKEDDRTDRKWLLLARRRAEDARKAATDRRAFVIAQLQRIAAAARAGRYSESAALREDLQKRYARYPDLADLLGPPPEPEAQNPNPNPKPATEIETRPVDEPKPPVRSEGAGTPIPEPAPPSPTPPNTSSP